MASPGANRQRLSASSPPARPRERLGERIVVAGLALCAAVVTLITAGFVLVLLFEAVGFFSEVSLFEFLTEPRWTPLFREKHFGILPLLSGSVLVGFLAVLLALPGGILVAVFLSEVAWDGLGSFLRTLLHALSGVPTVVYGYFALTFVTPFLQRAVPGVEAFSALSAGVVLGVMILPTVATLSEDAIRRVPWNLRERAYALGATRFEVTTRVAVPAAAPGIFASFLVGLSRALGETMVVAMAAGNSARLTLNPLEAIQTLSAYLLQAGQGNIAPDSLDYQTRFAVGTTLFLLTTAINLAGRRVIVASGRGWA